MVSIKYGTERTEEINNLLFISSVFGRSNSDVHESIGKFTIFNVPETWYCSQAFYPEKKLRHSCKSQADSDLTYFFPLTMYFIFMEYLRENKCETINAYWILWIGIYALWPSEIFSYSVTLTFLLTRSKLNYFLCSFIYTMVIRLEWKNEIHYEITSCMMHVNQLCTNEI